MAFMGIPFDSRLVEGDDGSFYEDRTVFSADIAHYFGHLSTDGICLDLGETLGNQLKVKAGTGSNVILNPGTIKIQGRMGWITEAETIQATAGSSRPRYDTAVIELNLNVAVRGFTFKLIQGTPAASPTPPALTRNENVWQLGLANIYRAANSTSLGTITDTRKDEDRCGISSINAPLDMVPLANGGTNVDLTNAPGGSIIAKSNSAQSLSYYTSVPVNKGGTGATTIAAARKNLGLGNTSGAVPIANGGTGATSAAAAVNNLGLGGVGDLYEVSFSDTGVSVNTNKTLASLTLPAGTYVISYRSTWATANANLYITAFLSIPGSPQSALCKGNMGGGGGLNPIVISKLENEENIVSAIVSWSGGSGSATHKSGTLRAVRII